MSMLARRATGLVINAQIQIDDIMENKFFKQEEIEAISAALGDMSDGLTGSEIVHILSVCRMADPDPALTKRNRIHNVLVGRAFLSHASGVTGKLLPTKMNSDSRTRAPGGPLSR